MWWLLATFGTPATAADMPQPTARVIYLQNEAPALALPPQAFADDLERRLQKAKDLRNVGVGLSLGGAAAIFPGLILAVVGGVNDDRSLTTGGIVVALAGTGAALVGPGVTLAGGYVARKLVVELGEPPNMGLDVVAWVSYIAVPLTGISWVPAVGLSWAFANVMIARADSLLYERRVQRDDGPSGRLERQFTVRALPTYDLQNRRAGLRIDFVY